MDIVVAGVPFHEWKYTTKEWWVRNPLDSLPLDGSARLMSGTPKQVGHLAATGNLPTNIVGATAADYVSCDLPILGLCFAMP